MWLQQCLGDKLHCYEAQAGKRLDVEALLTDQRAGTQVYVCGPSSLINAVCDAAKALGWPDSRVQYERFSVPNEGPGFRVWLQRSGRSIDVAAGESLLEVLEREQVPVRNGEEWRWLNRPLGIDQSPENYPQWGPSRASVTADNVARLVHLCVELQGLHRLPRSHALLFPIRTYLICLQDLVTQPGWSRRLRRVLMTLPPELVDYKGLTRYIGTVIDWLEPRDRDD